MTFEQRLAEVRSGKKRERFDSFLARDSILKEQCKRNRKMSYFVFKIGGGQCLT